MPNATETLHQALIPIAATVTAIAVLSVAIYAIRWWLRENDGPAASDNELLSEYREMHRRGELSDQEFRIIKGRMAPRISGASESKRNLVEVDKVETEKMEKSALENPLAPRNVPFENSETDVVENDE